MKQNFAVIGLGRFGTSICRVLAAEQQEVLAIDINEDRVNDLADVATEAIVADAQDEETLRSLEIGKFDHVIVAIGKNIQANILVTLIVKELGVPDITAKAENDTHARVLARIGADQVVHPERDMGARVAHHLLSPNILNYLAINDDVTMAEVKITSSAFVDKSLTELNFHQRFGLTVIAIQHGDNVIVSPAGSDVVQLNDEISVVGPTQAVEELNDRMNN
ncbi:MAG: TrkA family potassium uptake protein [Loigolactobacillus coryniformis]|uniref:Potassium uptake protein n=1 Tax=Loigolactobacillus coryniformis subsp. coryniformis CECT 5711 TaxID=1185325 RepID=J3EQW9_9LACO|nr:TrkA family potassium uptake protein [Loigolactobacillus coryniformis]EJN55885.1 Potassium uptake protein [Loigolactobacillus coryniformis subsp. coryniformis CECT 5711]MBW4803358.1 TrkA family potassium uptake protein [Loigolactobacillus coryniformis subsp. torquens]MBW4806054.1 TrkA family potassium uptake protein [Loigolactobacillus coryniformis subsp. torquens]MDN5954419.1 TrkA family potassium uptake protein [Loigolactobacillus coryniformis]